MQYLDSYWRTSYKWLACVVLHTYVGKVNLHSLERISYLSDGGFLQSGSPNTQDPANLLYETEVRCIIVMPAYRLNIFGFLACQELYQEALDEGSTVGNLGFWDQRLALEWTYKHVKCFGGNMYNITVGGMSAGAHSAFYQLAFELSLPANQAIIRRVVLWSNGPGVETKSLLEVQDQFHELIALLGISRKLEAEEKLAKLRALPPNRLLEAVSKMKINSFRAVTDSVFVKKCLFQDIESGRFALKMLRRGIRIMIGDLPDEATLYRLIKPPSSYEGLIDRLSVEYPRATCKLLGKIYCPDQLPIAGSSWQDTFGFVYTDVQIYVTARGFIAALARTLPLNYIYRYRINWRAKCVDSIYPKKMGIAHASDLAIWFYGNGANLFPAEKKSAKRFLEPFAAFLRGDECEWGPKSIRQARALASDGSIEIVEDVDWERSLKVWDTLQNATLSKL